MSSFADSLFSEFGLPALESVVGEAGVAYVTPRGGAKAGPFDVILENVTTRRVENENGQVFEHERFAKFPRQDGLPFWPAQSLVGFVVTLGEVEWALDLVEALSESLATVRLVRRVTSEISKPGYRRK